MDLCFEKQAWERGSEFVVGVDESGRGPLAGPVTAAAVAVVPSSVSTFHPTSLLKEINDSKKLSAEKREELYKVLKNHPHIFWEVSWVTPQVIDRINILEATKRAMKRAVEKLEADIGGKADFLFLDGRMNLDLDREQKGVEKGDSKIFSCAAGSVVAKVFRDRTMQRYHRLFPRYRFDLHKGYATSLHREKIKKYGPCRIHRHSFEQVGNYPDST